MAEDCASCPYSLIRNDESSESEATRQERYELFHQSCPTCSLAKFQDESMCDFCQHLRLRHLARCVTPEIRRAFQFPLQKGLADISVMTKCPLCRIVKHMLAVGLSGGQLSELKGTNYELVLCLAPPQSPQSRASSALSADVYASYPEGENGTSNIWVGDLYIDDIDKGKRLSLQSTCT